MEVIAALQTENDAKDREVKGLIDEIEELKKNFNFKESELKEKNEKKIQGNISFQ